MKQKIYITALLAGMLALAGCGGGGSSDGGGGNGDGNGGGTKCDTDQTLDTATNTCKTNPPDPNAVNHEQARKDALALYNVLDSSSVNSSDNGTEDGEFGADRMGSAAANEGIQSFKGPGTDFEGTTPPSGLTAITTDPLPDNLKGYFNVAGGSTAIKVTGFPSGSDQVTHTIGTTITGAFMGVDGTFQCYADDCYSRLADDGKFTLSESSWRFKPDDPTHKVEGSAILEWGWWVDDIAKVTTASVGYGFVSGVTATTANLDGLASTASYTGTALGKYAVVEKDTGSSGDFTAAAKLTADFDENMLTGTINAFKDADDADLGWTVKLESKVNMGALSEGAFVDVDENKNSVVWTHDGDDFTTEDAWIATAYGGNATGGNATEAPEYILGEFQANHLNARMIGAFGVEKDKQGN